MDMQLIRQIEIYQPIEEAREFARKELADLQAELAAGFDARRIDAAFVEVFGDYETAAEWRKAIEQRIAGCRRFLAATEVQS